MLLSPHSLLSHGGSDSRGKDIVYNMVQTLQNYDMAFSNISGRISKLFGKTQEDQGDSRNKIFPLAEMNEIHGNIEICKNLVQKLHLCIQQLKGLSRLLETTGHAPHETYFKTLSLLDTLVLAKKIVDAYSVQTCVNSNLVKELVESRSTHNIGQLLLVFSLQPVTHSVKHYRAMLYVDCIK